MCQMHVGIDHAHHDHCVFRMRAAGGAVADLSDARDSPAAGR